MGGSSIRYQDAKKALKQFNDFNEADDLFQNEADYVLDMILLQCFAGNDEDAKTLIENLSSANLTEKQSNRLALIKTAIALSEYQLEDVERNLEDVLELLKKGKTNKHIIGCWQLKRVS